MNFKHFFQNRAVGQMVRLVPPLLIVEVDGSVTSPDVPRMITEVDSGKQQIGLQVGNEMLPLKADQIREFRHGDRTGDLVFLKGRWIMRLRERNLTPLFEYDPGAPA